jgi:hypothetical protein
MRSLCYQTCQVFCPDWQTTTFSPSLRRPGFTVDENLTGLNHAGARSEPPARFYKFIITIVEDKP